MLGEPRVTVICPAIVTGEWVRTFTLFGDIPRGPHVLGVDRPRANEPEALIVSFDRASKPDVARALGERGGVLVLDEAHYLKEPDSRRTQALIGEHGLAHRFKHVFFLTGTPVSNHAGELFPLLRFAGLWRHNYWEFLDRYCVTRETDYGFQVVAHRNVDELRTMLGAFMLRRPPEQVSLPPTTYGEIRVGLASLPRDSEVYREIRRSERHTAATLQRSLARGDAQFETEQASRLRRLVALAKAPATIRAARGALDADPSHKVVIFSLHTTGLTDVLADALHEYQPISLTGATPAKRKPDLVARFQSDPSTRVALCQIRAAGVGVTLTAANCLLLAEQSWTPADNDQAIRRIVRIGQKRTTHVRKLILTGSIDEAVNGVLSRKARLVDEIINQTL
jgi:SWI/SNF-related matrix-associated actin-dependent regulator 1 of chromatin subfamily A